MKKVIHVIPVPPGRTADEAWSDIRSLGCLSGPIPASEDDCEWAVVVEETDE